MKLTLSSVLAFAAAAVLTAVPQADAYLRSLNAQTSGKSFIAPIHKPEIAAVTATDNIAYTPGRPVLTGPTTLHLYYYGSWTSNQKSIVEDFTANLGASTWYNTMSSYYYQASSSASKQYVKTGAGSVNLGSTTSDNYSKGKSLSGTTIPDLLTAAIKSGALPDDNTALYAFLMAGDVKETIRPDLGKASFCTDYCGYHVSFTIGSKRYYYALLGQPTACLSGCSPNNQNKSPNGEIGVDAMLSAYAHEIVEAISDPVSDVDSLRAWQDSQGEENADKCAYKYGTTKTSSNGATYNINVGSRQYLVQQNWAADTQQCETGRPYSGPTPAPTPRPTPGPSPGPTPRPTPSPTPAPTPAPTTAPSQCPFNNPTICCWFFNIC